MTEDYTRNFQQVLNAVSSVNHNLSTVSDQVTEVTTQVGVVSRDLAVTSDELRELRKDFQEYVLQAERTANVQRSETVLGNVEAALEREYGHYKVVRRTSIGTLQAFDLGNVSNHTVQQISEELMIQTPRYWLAPALVALASWSRDDEDLCSRSIDAAFSRDPRKTSLFFALTLRRQGRLESSTRWLKHYLSSLDPHALSREFAVILEAAAQDAFGAHGQQLIAAQLTEWNQRLRADQSVVAAQITAWQNEISLHRPTVVDAEFPHLSKISPQWDDVKQALECAGALGFTQAKYAQIKNSPNDLGLSTIDRLDDILELLVTEFDAEELPFQRDAVYHRAVIEHAGDLDRARQEADALNVALEETLDVISLQTQSALRPDLLGVSIGTQKVAIGVSRDDFQHAVGAFTADYRMKHLDKVELTLDQNHSNYAQTLGFKGWKTDTELPQAEAEKSLAGVWESSVAEYLERVRFKESYYLKAGGIALALSVLGFLIFGLGGLLVLLVSGGAAGYMVWKNKTDAEKKYQEALAMREQAFQFSVDIYRAAVAEYVDTKLLYSDEDAKEQPLLNLIGTWPTVAGRQEISA
ncbi:hypothetical protein [Rhodococcus sovatensis]|uniref:Uncharacterized protein n=1 Tax=Rhodococcus sovatensis TaxID=1805840 RepID=A0ABZ2PNU8_9NOCA